MKGLHETEQLNAYLLAAWIFSTESVEPDLLR